MALSLFLVSVTTLSESKFSAAALSTTNPAADLAACVDRVQRSLDLAVAAPESQAASPCVRFDDLQDALRRRGHAVLEDVTFQVAELETILQADVFREVTPGRGIGRAQTAKATFVDHRFRRGLLEPRCHLNDVAQELGTAARRIVEALNPELLSYADNFQSEDLSTSVFRVCRYDPGSRCLGAHTDTSFVTVIPVSEPGLQVYDPNLNAWLRPEDGQDDGLVVLTGEYTDLLTNGTFPAAVHRVTTPDHRRYSTPLLLRADPHQTFGGPGVTMTDVWKALQFSDPSKASAFINDLLLR